ncbi:MRG-domain-containing protein [Basidiobolus meristosporus CBS 931.73]|uniref:Chromatin modification-related protein EAF3 n=1 Tax=Basidiobolus meristosporus CBS 931.73 TaxID=1314790 RepID=A0A1Y1YTX0_9FUNG|nr:MRG-domain-containing protein [Basidiobolus meristosporus CBS 931.73]|eukprot:ORY01480.1 MRG-domain-containing protein [Basidiobolus meristosporus CBS 931.73]
MTGKDSRSLAFIKDEKILCYHGPLLYEAKVLQCEWWEGNEQVEEGGHYYVHYKGWKQTWDEWVPESRVLKYNEENLATQAALKAAVKTKKKSSSKEKAPSEASKSRKRARENSAEKTKSQDDGSEKRPEVKLSIPSSLKLQLVDDWENITKLEQLVPLPRKITVTQILGMYRESKEKKRSSKEKEDILNEVLDGLRLYFNNALGTILLYRFERQQYVDICKQHPNCSMSDIYGAEHLLRLFVQLPMLIAHTSMDQEAINILRDHFTEFMKYLQKNAKEIFISQYEKASDDYIEKFKST